MGHESLECENPVLKLCSLLLASNEHIMSQCKEKGKRRANSNSFGSRKKMTARVFVL